MTVIVDGYTLKFNVPTANGLVALKITTPKGYTLELGVAQCKAPPS
ncbi:MAG TPA: hypothetical protein VHT30_04110 [Acidimicrobiales bacterium]|jgi:hypothetical protein|nr:hypothetical protein [Acidimicrobiales bacterium]